jgi:hypothetical protein
MLLLIKYLGADSKKFTRLCVFHIFNCGKIVDNDLHGGKWHVRSHLERGDESD